MKSTNALILILISIGLFYTFIDPQYERAKALQLEAAEYEHVLDNAELIAATRDDLLIEYEEFPNQELERLEKVLPSHVDTVSLAKDFDTIASRYGISMQGIQVDTSRDQNSTTIIQSSTSAAYEKVTITFTIVSSYQSFRNFLNDIERSLRIIDIRSLSFRSTDSGLYEYSITIDTYWLK